MAYTLEQHTILKDAIASGVTVVKYGDKDVQYRSLTEMLKILSIMESELGLNTSVNRRKYVEQGRGF